ncbi:MAG: tRNA (adenine(22)-N(1))-methyltransferase TrmK [Clostridia bacterium]|nr:tRNA (adenine(22)-N(1))-methyltransferase TrmK [Clostridia bacterium]
MIDPMNHKSLDPRLSLAFSLYDTCVLAADIGTDHARLPAALLKRGRCQHMVLTDISQSALENARMEIVRRHLYDRVSLRLGDGLASRSRGL